MSAKQVSKKSKQKQITHEERVFRLGSELLRTLEEYRLLRNDETIKGVGWFLVCIGESLAKGSLRVSRNLRTQQQTGQIPKIQSLPIAFCLVGDQIMDWGTAELLRERKNKHERNKK